MDLPNFISPIEKHFGLSVGRTSVRAVEIGAGNSTKATEVKFNAAIFSGGVLTNKEVFKAAMQKLLQDAKFSTKYVAVCFSEAYAYSREYSVPKLSPDEVTDAISWHLNDLFPFAASDIYFDWKLVEETDEGYKVTVVAVQKQVIDPIVEVLTGLGLKPLSFVPGSSIISKILQLKEKQKALLCDVSSVGAYVTLVEAQQALFTTVVNVAKTDTPESYVKNIISTISELLQYYRERKVLGPNEGEIILSGELSNEAVKNQLSTQLKLPAQILTTPLNNPAFNKAFAVAVTAVAPPHEIHTINVLPPDIQSRYDRDRVSEFYTKLMANVNAVFFIALFISIAAFIVVSFERQRLDYGVKQASGFVKTQKPETQKLLTLNAAAKQVTILAKLRTTPKAAIAAISDILFDSITIEGWEYDDQKLTYTLSGKAADRADLLAFKDRLENSGEFTQVSLPLESLSAPIDVPFTLSFSIKP